MHCSNKKLHVMETNFTLNKKERKKGWGGVYHSSYVACSPS